MGAAWEGGGVATRFPSSRQILFGPASRLFGLISAVGARPISPPTPAGTPRQAVARGAPIGIAVLLDPGKVPVGTCPEMRDAKVLPQYLRIVVRGATGHGGSPNTQATFSVRELATGGDPRVPEPTSPRNSENDGA